MRDSDDKQETVYWLRRLAVARARPLAALPAGAAQALPRLRRDYGAVLEAADGWRRAYDIEWLRQKELARALGNVLVVEETASTNQTARQFAPPFFVFAEHQNSGRGRRGKQWLSLPGDALLMSAVLPPPPSPALFGGLSVAVGATVWQKLAGDGRLRFKWPNDLLDVAGNKVGGILIELGPEKIIVGIGLNLRLTSPLTARINRLGGRPPGALRDVLPFARRRGAIVLARAAAAAVETFSRRGFAAFQTLARSAHVAADGDVICLSDGSRAAFAGFAADGALITRRNGRLSRHVAADEFSHVARH